MKFDLMLDASDVDFIEQLKSALGVKNGDTLEIITPQFERVDGRVIQYFPRSVAEFDALKLMSDSALEAVGCGVWDEGHWLYPKEWYWNIPNGYEVTDICGETEIFVPGKTDDDIRFGCLAFGFVKGTAAKDSANVEGSTKNAS